MLDPSGRLGLHLLWTSVVIVRKESKTVVIVRDSSYKANAGPFETLFETPNGDTVMASRFPVRVMEDLLQQGFALVCALEAGAVEGGSLKVLDHNGKPCLEVEV